MHKATPSWLIRSTLLTAAAVVAASLSSAPATAQVEQAHGTTTATVDVAGEWPTVVSDLELIEEPVPLESSPVQDIEDGSAAVTLGDNDDELLIEPQGIDQTTVQGGLLVGTAEGGEHSVSVIPVSDGVQLVLSIDSATAPTDYVFDLSGGGGVNATLTPAGEVGLTSEAGDDLGIVEAPWAYDADGAPVPTHFELVDGAIVQVVEHTSADFSYPITADPSVKNCNWYTATCVKFSKSETNKIAGFTKNAAGAAALCGFIPHVVARVACGVIMIPSIASVIDTFKSAKAQGRCVEIKFQRLPFPPYHALIGWKVVSC